MGGPEGDLGAVLLTRDYVGPCRLFSTSAVVRGFTPTAKIGCKQNGGFGTINDEADFR